MAGGRRAEAEGGAGRLSRRKLLRLAAYSVPTVQMLSLGLANRALALTPLPGCEFPVRVKWVDSNRPGYKAVCCKDNGSGYPAGTEHREFQPTHCDYFVSTGVNGEGFVFVDCQTEGLWEPTGAVCYTFTACPDPQNSDCYQAWQNCV